MTTWKEHQDWERDWHGNCVNSFNEEQKQFVYAKKMGLSLAPSNKTPFRFDLGNKSIIDIGGGPYSLLLKCENFSSALVVDPCEYPDWVYSRYDSAGIAVEVVSGEEMTTRDVSVDEVWIYNVLQHVKNPEGIIKKALYVSKIIRIFEWIENGIAMGHPNNLTKSDLDMWLGGIGKTEDVNEGGCVGLSYYGIFKGKRYGVR